LAGFFRFYSKNRLSNPYKRDQPLPGVPLRSAFFFGLFPKWGEKFGDRGEKFGDRGKSLAIGEKSLAIGEKSLAIGEKIFNLTPEYLFSSEFLVTLI
jgi:hypothetical protein